MNKKKLLSEKQRNNDLYKNESNPNSKRIICIETGEIFDCIKFAKQKYNIKHDGSLTVALKDKKRTAGGLHWVYYSEHYLDEKNRFNYLYSVLLECNSNSIICTDDFMLYSSRIELARKLNVTDSKIKYNLDKYKKFLYNGKTYVLLKEYNSRFI